jgi:hypothetical protein
MTLSNIFKLGFIDKAVCKYCDINPEKEIRFQETRNKWEEVKRIHYDMDVIDQKSSALLTHISVMFVVLSILLTASKTPWISIFFATELVAYLFVAMTLLRCIDVMGPPFRELPEDVGKAKNAYYIEILLRREVYHRAVRLVYILTLFLIPVVIVKYAL